MNLNIFLRHFDLPSLFVTRHSWYGLAPATRWSAKQRSLKKFSSMAGTSFNALMALRFCKEIWSESYDANLVSTFRKILRQWRLMPWDHVLESFLVATLSKSCFLFAASTFTIDSQRKQKIVRNSRSKWMKGRSKGNGSEFEITGSWKKPSLKKWDATVKISSNETEVTCFLR